MDKKSNKEKVMLAGVDLSDYIAQQEYASKMLGEPLVITASELLSYCLSSATTQAQRIAVRDEYKAHPEKYPDMDTSYDSLRRKRSKKPEDVLDMLDELATRDPMGKIRYTYC